MDVRHCRRCRKLYNYLNSPFCPNCLDYFEQSFEIVRKFIHENPSANFAQVVEGSGIEDKVILEFIRDGRLEFTVPDLGIPCEVCGTRIASGKFCPNCSSKVKQKLENTKRELERRARTGEGFDPKAVAKRSARTGFYTQDAKQQTSEK